MKPHKLDMGRSEGVLTLAEDTIYVLRGGLAGMLEDRYPTTKGRYG
jgi:hypothetical protein